MRQSLETSVLFSPLTPALSPLRGEGDGAALTLESVLVFRLFSASAANFRIFNDLTF
jgi:hypothetical protein